MGPYHDLPCTLEIILPVLQVGEPRLREVPLTWSNTVNKWQSGNLNATSVTLSARLFCCNTAGLLPKAEPA